MARVELFISDHCQLEGSDLTPTLLTLKGAEKTVRIQHEELGLKDA